MKRMLLSLALVLGFSLSAGAMSYDEARQQAWFLTDKMAYELNLTPEQYDRAYQVNLDYLMSLRTASDCYGHYWNYRNIDMRCILFDWQYTLYSTIEYFFRPVRWVRSSWYYPVFDHYRRGYYYFSRPTVYVSYHGGGWHRRGHNDVSPYHGMNFRPGHGMRDRYHQGPGGGRPGGHPSHGRPGHNPSHGGHGSGVRPGHGGGRPQGNVRPGGGSDVRPGHGNGRPGGNGGVHAGQGGSRPGSGPQGSSVGSGRGGHRGGSSVRPSSGNGSSSRGSGVRSGSNSSRGHGGGGRSFGR